MNNNMEEEPLYTEIHVQPPFFDLKVAYENYGVDLIYEITISTCLRELYIESLIPMRKAWHFKNLSRLRQCAYSINTKSKYLNSHFIRDTSDVLRSSAQNLDNLEIIEDLYVDLVARMKIFLEFILCYCSFYSKINLVELEIPLKESIVKEYFEKLEEVNIAESAFIKNQILEHNQFLLSQLRKEKFPFWYSKWDLIDYKQKVIMEDKKETATCTMSSCSIF